mmetsp:Transcript_33994/g.71512  ORF Transcript_33994/g.71512 Transcript_33994/m.71512 type:complete len:762 (+) Transcript_33994:35-2320(+)
MRFAMMDPDKTSSSYVAATLAAAATKAATSAAAATKAATQTSSEHPQQDFSPFFSNLVDTIQIFSQRVGQNRLVAEDAELFVVQNSKWLAKALARFCKQSHSVKARCRVAFQEQEKKKKMDTNNLLGPAHDGDAMQNNTNRNGENESFISGEDIIISEKFGRKRKQKFHLLSQAEIYNLVKAQLPANHVTCITRHEQETCHALYALDRTCDNQQHQQHRQLRHQVKQSENEPLPVLVKNAIKIEGEKFQLNEQSLRLGPSSTSCMRCYMCSSVCRTPHPIYVFCCQSCGNLSQRNRNLCRDLSGQVAVVLGGRTKLGHQVVLKLLDAGCDHVICTTRYPEKAKEMFGGYHENAIALALDRVSFVGLDLDTADIAGSAQMEALSNDVEEYAPNGLHILVNCAAQTIRARDKPGDSNNNLPLDDECVVDEPLVAEETSHNNLPLENECVDEPLNVEETSHIESKRIVSSIWQFSSYNGQQVVEYKKRRYCDSVKRTGLQQKEGRVVNNDSNTLNSTDNEAKKGMEQVHQEQTKTKDKRGVLNRYGDSRYVNSHFKNSWALRLEDICQRETEEVYRVSALGPMFVIQQLLPYLRRAVEANSESFQGGLSGDCGDGVDAVDALQRDVVAIESKNSASDDSPHNLTAENESKGSGDEKRCAYIINIHAREGLLSVARNDKHVHTNMAKASLAMLTSALAGGLGSNRLRVHGCDPGWFSVDEYYEDKRPWVAPPLDEVDAAARVLYPLWMELPSCPKTRRHFTQFSV